MMRHYIHYTCKALMLVVAISIAQILIGESCVSAQVLRVNAPQQVSVGEQFRLQYTLDTSSRERLMVGQIPDELEILYGPSRSESSSFQMINGHTSSSSSVTFTYMICANKQGTYTIPAAYINVDGKKIQSKSIKIQVTAATARQKQQQGARVHDDDSNRQVRRSDSKITSNDLFITVNANKTRVHEQEPILLTYKVYTLVDLTQLDGKMPDLKGFHTQEIPLPQQKSFRIEKHNGQTYRTVVWSQYVMYPQMTGKLEIPSINFNGLILQQNRSIDPFEAFFNGGSGYTEVKKTIVAPSLTIQVDPLPAHPDNFSGGVGEFAISANVDKKDVKANDPVTLRVVIDGVGNLKLLKQPVVKFPNDFDKYDPKVTDKTKLSTRGLEGSMVYDFIVVPRHKGHYTIPSIDFVYYDVKKQVYNTLHTSPIDLNVKEGSGTGGSMTDYSNSDVELLNKDIHFIKKGDVEMYKRGEYFFGSTLYMVLIIVLISIFVILLIIFRKRAMMAADIVGTRGRKANKVAVKRLRKASKLMIAGKQGEFYDEVLRALWGYVGDKLNMPIQELSKDNIAEQLSSRSIGSETIDIFIDALDECEYARYAPGDPKGKMDRVYEKAYTAIMDIDNNINKKKI